MIAMLLLITAIAMFGLTAWLAKSAYDVGLPEGKRRGSQLCVASFGAVSVLAVAGWINKLDIPITPEARAAIVSHDASRLYHRADCRFAKGAQPIATASHLRPCPYCRPDDGEYQRTAHRPDSKPEGNPADARQDVLSLLHEPTP